MLKTAEGSSEISLGEFKRENAKPARMGFIGEILEGAANSLEGKKRIFLDLRSLCSHLAVWKYLTLRAMSRASFGRSVTLGLLPNMVRRDPGRDCPLVTGMS